MNNLSTTAKKLDKVFEIAGIVLFAVGIACVVFIVLLGKYQNHNTRYN